MAATTTMHIHLGKEDVEVLADLRYLEDEASDHRYWTLEVDGYGDGATHLVLFLAPHQLETVKDQLETIITQFQAHLSQVRTVNA